MTNTSLNQELQFLSTIPIHWFIKLGMSVLCGAIVGIERELKRKAAGLRTNVMICIGATLYMLLSDLILSGHPASTDATRMAGQVVVGMGFIGAGTIIQSRGRVMGLTSAATLWVVAAIGLVIGAGYPLLALIITLCVVFLLYAVGKFEFVLLGKCRIATVQVSFRDNPQTWVALRTLFENYGKKIDNCHWTRENEICFMEVGYCSVHPDHKEFFIDLLHIPDIRQASHPRPL